MTRPEPELVALAQKGDLSAFDELVLLHQRRVYSLAYRMLGNADDASDVQQEVFVRAWQSIKRFRGEASFTTWLHRIAVNMCLSRKRKRQTISLDNETLENIADSNRQASVMCIESTATAVTLKKVIMAMPAHYRILLVLREMEQRSFEEIAQVLKCSVQSARSRACKARKMLRDKMRPYLAED